MRTLSLRILLSIAIVTCATDLHTVAAQDGVFQASIAPLPDDDLASECQYELALTDPTKTVQAVWVIFDRGRDMLRYYGDPDVYAFAQRHGWALLLPFHCRAKSGTDGDMNMDPSQGPASGRIASLTLVAIPGNE